MPPLPRPAHAAPMARPRRRPTRPGSKRDAGRGERPAGPADTASPGRHRWWRDAFGIDPRSLALFRIVLGLTLLIDLGIRAADLGAMYTDAGMFSRGVVCLHFTNPWNWSFHFGSGAAWYQGFLFGLAAVLALALVAGCRTRLAAIGSWLLLVSLHNRVPPILNGSDNLLRMLLFWGMFLPLGRAWSVDQRGRQRGGNPDLGARNLPVASAASVAILLQMALMYWCSAAFKTNGEWLTGAALDGMLAHDFYAKPFAAVLLRLSAILPVLTIGVLALEWLGPLLLFAFGSLAWLRVGAIALLAAMHVGIELSLHVGLFSFASLAGLCLFLPAVFWNHRLVSRSPAGLPSRHDESGAASSPAAAPMSRVAQATCAMALVYVILVNVASLPGPFLDRWRPDRWEPFWTGLGLGQSWGMFGETPSRNGWFVARAKLADGSGVDLLRDGSPVDWNRPAFPATHYPNHRWRKLFREMSYTDDLGFQVFRRPVAGYLGRSWDAAHPGARQVRELALVFCTMPTREIAAPFDTPPPQVMRETLYRKEFGDE